MPVFPTQRLNKADLRSLLQSIAHHQTPALNAQTRRGAEQWAIAANLLGDRRLTDADKLVTSRD